MREIEKRVEKVLERNDLDRITLEIDKGNRVYLAVIPVLGSNAFEFIKGNPEEVQKAVQLMWLNNVCRQVGDAWEHFKERVYSFRLPAVFEKEDDDSIGTIWWTKWQYGIAKDAKYFAPFFVMTKGEDGFYRFKNITIDEAVELLKDIVMQMQRKGIKNIEGNEKVLSMFGYGVVSYAASMTEDGRIKNFFASYPTEYTLYGSPEEAIEWVKGRLAEIPQEVRQVAARRLDEYFRRKFGIGFDAM